MRSIGALTPVPWRYHESAGLRVWNWETKHFYANITSDDGGPFLWKVHDGSGRAPRLLASGETPTFTNAENAVREVVGKSYRPALGYLEFAGSLAMTFALSNGQRIDLSPFLGHVCSVTVLLEDRSTRVVVGQFSIYHYDVLIEQPNGTVLKVQPASIVTINRETEDVVIPGKEDADSRWLGVGRVYRGRVREGCTGLAGFLSDTVDHSGPLCPVHEVPAEIRAHDLTRTMRVHDG